MDNSSLIVEPSSYTTEMLESQKMAMDITINVDFLTEVVKKFSSFDNNIADNLELMHEYVFYEENILASLENLLGTVKYPLMEELIKKKITQFINDWEFFQERWNVNFWNLYFNVKLERRKYKPSRRPVRVRLLRKNLLRKLTRCLREMMTPFSKIMILSGLKA